MQDYEASLEQTEPVYCWPKYITVYTWLEDNIFGLNSLCYAVHYTILNKKNSPSYE
jgi:hypothetical protein